MNEPDDPTRIESARHPEIAREEEPKPTGSKYVLAGEMFYVWHVGIRRYEDRDASGRIRIGTYHNHVSYWVRVDNLKLHTRFRLRETDAKAAIKMRNEIDKAKASAS